MARSVGTDLRQAREQAGLSLLDLSARTKIRVAMLEAIEQDQFERLPAGLLTRGYLRAYAREVGLDPETIVRQYAEEFHAEPLPPPLHRELPDTKWDPEPVAHTRWRILAPAIPLTLAAFFFMLMSRPAKIARPLPVAAVEPVTSVGTTGQQPADAAGVPDAAIVSDTAVVPDTTVVPDTATGTVAPAAERLRIEIHPTSLTWIEASVDGVRVLYELVDAGQRRMLEADREISLLVGDAGAFAYSINGTPGRALGGSSEVRDVRITRENLGTFLGDDTDN